MSRHFDKLIAEFGTSVDLPKKDRTEPLLHQEIESFVKGFGLSAAATAQIVNAWARDAQNNYQDGYGEGYDEGAQS